jgi:predicted cupin superfamily sugar epimerase
VADPIHDAAQTVIDQLGLRPHPEGGWYREEHRSAISVHRPDGAERSALTLIWFLLQAPEISRWHRVLGADETWHHAGGHPLELWVLPPEGGEARPHLLGPLDAPVAGGAATGLDGARPVQVVPADWWQAARCLGPWSLVTCCVGPGFDFQDFQLLHALPASAHPPGALGELL